MQRPQSAPSTGRSVRIGRTSSGLKLKRRSKSPPLDSGEKPSQACEQEPSWTVSESMEKLNNRRTITLQRSIFPDRTPTLYFDYEGKIPPDNLIHDRKLPKMYYNHSSAVHPYNCVLNTLRRGGLLRCSNSSGKWCLLWGGHPKPESLRNYHSFQKTNHFPGSWNLGRKDLIWRHISRMQRAHGSAFNIHPQSFLLPEDAKSFVAAMQANPKTVWIYKPNLGSCGRGIRLITGSDPSQHERLLKKSGVIQRYLGTPLLINGYKFDLRLYVAVTSIEPLKIWLFREGLARFATEKYSLASSTLKKTTMHLTNYSLNKHAENYVKNMDSPTSPARKRLDHCESSPERQFWRTQSDGGETVSTNATPVTSNSILRSSSMMCSGSTTDTSTAASTPTPEESSMGALGTPVQALDRLQSAPRKRIPLEPIDPTLRSEHNLQPLSPVSSVSPLARRIPMLRTDEPELDWECKGQSPVARKRASPRSPHSPPWSPSDPPVVDPDEGCDEDVSSKWSLDELRDYFVLQGWDYDALQKRIDDLITKSILAVEPTLVTSWHQGTTFQGDMPKLPTQNCSEVYGFDVLIDEKFKPWLLEVNVCPSLSSSSPLDKRIKTSLMADFLNLVGLRVFDHKLVDKQIAETRSQRLLGLSPQARTSKRQLVSKKDEVVFGPVEQYLISDFVEEVFRQGDFHRVFPTMETVHTYAPYFATTRYSNTVLSRWLSFGGEEMLRKGGKLWWEDSKLVCKDEYEVKRKSHPSMCIASQRTF